MARVQWVLNGYFLSLGGLTFLGGSLGDRYGHMRIFLTGLVGFAASSLPCAVAPGWPVAAGSLLAGGGVASGVDNATPRLVGLVGTVGVPLGAGLGGLADLTGAGFAAGYARALQVAAALCAALAVLAPLTLRTCLACRPTSHPSPTLGCVERARE